MSALDFFISEMSNNDFSWQEKAACRGANTDMFFLEEDQTKINQKKLVATRELCGGCLVSKECLDFALDNYIHFGIWAGTTPLQRKAMRRERRS
jgi:WhiB family transcriptional regulator, redox-sensing transcriptional regulator